jgi:hypothetical protein
MIYTHVLEMGGGAVRSPLDALPIAAGLVPRPADAVAETDADGMGDPTLTGLSGTGFAPPGVRMTRGVYTAGPLLH